MKKFKIIQRAICIILCLGIIVLSALPALAQEEASEKEEVIYVNLYSGGSVKEVYAVNIFEGKSITDYGDYDEVKLLNSNEKITRKDDKITFSSDKSRVYLQGDMGKAKIPWAIEISYKLDGKAISSSDIAGKSGAVEINFKISENEKYKGSFYDNYALQCAFTLDTQRFSNIKADGATIANVGSDKQISYTILPGKGVDSYITADATEFEMPSVSINAVLLSMDIEVDDTELMEQVNELIDAAKRIDDGANEIRDGAGELKANGKTLNYAGEELSSGAEALNGSFSTYSSGVNQIHSGLNELSSNSESLTSGSSEVKSALSQIQIALSSVESTGDEIEMLVSYSAEIKSGISAINGSIKTLEENCGFDAYKTAMGANGLDIDGLKKSNSDAVSALSQQVDEINRNISMLELIGGYDEEIEKLKAQAQELNNLIMLLSANNGAIDGTKQYLDTMNENISRLAEASQKLDKSYAEFDAGINQLADRLSETLYNLSALAGAINQLVAEYEKLDSGINEYTGSVAQIVAGYSQIAEGTKELASGSSTLNNATSEYYSGMSKYLNGVNALYSGTEELSEGTGELRNKTSDLDTQAQSKLDDIISSISGDESEVSSFVSEKNTNVKSVQFIIKTDAIEIPEVDQAVSQEKEKLNFWQKLLALFGIEKN